MAEPKQVRTYTPAVAGAPTVSCPGCGHKLTIAIAPETPLVITMRREQGKYSISASDGAMTMTIHVCGTGDKGGASSNREPSEPRPDGPVVLRFRRRRADDEGLDHDSL